MRAPGTDENEEVAMAALNLGAKWNRQVVAVWLHGSPNVTSALNKLDLEVDRSFLKARNGSYTWQQWRAERVVAEEALEAFLEAVRDELELPKLAIRVRGETVEDDR